MDQIFRTARWLPDWLKDWVIQVLDRREAPRRKVMNLKAYYWEGTGAADHVVRDISASGAFILADFKWLPGTGLTMTLQLQGQTASGSPRSTVVQTRVVRQTPNGIGVQFLYLNKSERKSVTNFLQSVPDASMRRESGL